MSSLASPFNLLWTAAYIYFLFSTVHAFPYLHQKLLNLTPIRLYFYNSDTSHLLPMQELSSAASRAFFMLFHEISFRSLFFYTKSMPLLTSNLSMKHKLLPKSGFLRHAKRHSSLFCPAQAQKKNLLGVCFYNKLSSNG